MPSIKTTPKDYPELFYHVHQMDLVGPRYLTGDGSFYSVNIIDVTNHVCFVKGVLLLAICGLAMCDGVSVPN